MIQEFDLVINSVKQIVSPLGHTPFRGKVMSELSVRENESIGIKDGIITSIGKRKMSANRIVDGSNLVAMPGFVDCHTHIPFAGSRGNEFLLRLRGKNYMEIMKAGGGIASTVKEVHEISEAELFKSSMEILNRLLVRGVTTVEGKSGYGLDKENELKQLRVLRKLNEEHAIDVVSTFLGAHAFPEDYKDRKTYLDYLLSFMEDVRQFSLTTDIFCEKGVFEIPESRYYLSRAKELGFSIRLHADELAPSGGAKLGIELGALSVDHLISCDDEALRALGDSSTVAVLMPGTSFFLRESYAKGRALVDSNAIVAIGSDFNPGSCNIYDPFLVTHLAVTRCGLEIEEAITAYTSNSAFVLGFGERKGQLAEGFDADMLLLSLDDYRDIPYMFSRDVIKSVIKAGKVIV